MIEINNFRFLKKIIFIVAILSILVTNIYAWGSLWTFERVFATHQLLNEKAYEKLEKHPALLYVDFPSLWRIQDHGSVKIGPTGKYGLGPDVDGNSFFSEHWYNPNNGEGKAPETIKKYKDSLMQALATLEGKSSKKLYPEQSAHAAAYAAHYIQDMTCPMHVTGLSAVDNNGKLINLYDKNQAKNISPYAVSYTDEQWKILIRRYTKAYEEDTTKTLDFFDPLYFDANYNNFYSLAFDIAASELGSHFQYEMQVGLKYDDDSNSTNKWNDFKKDDKYIPEEYNNEIAIDELAKKAAAITREAMRKGGELWIDIGKNNSAYVLPQFLQNTPFPKESNRDVIYNSITVPYQTWWRAIQLTYVTWRSSFSALHIADFDIRFIKLQNQKNIYQPSIHVRNLEPESIARSVNVSLKISGDINFDGNVNIPGFIPKYKESDSSKDPDQGISDWINIGKTIMIKDIYDLNGKMEIIITGKYDTDIPDSGEKRVQYDLRDLYIAFEENSKDSDKCKDDARMEIKKIGREIESIKQLSIKSQNKCPSVKKLLDELQKQIALEINTLSKIRSQINDLILKMKNTQNTKEKLEDNDRKIEELAVDIENILSELGELSLKICKKTKTLNDHKIDDQEHENTSNWIQKNKKELKIYLNKVKERNKEIESYKKMINILIGKHKTIKTEEIDYIDKSIRNMHVFTKKIDNSLVQMNNMLIVTLKNVSIVYSRKQAVKKSLKSLEEKCGKELEVEIKNFYDQLKSIGLPRCSKGIETQIKGLKASSANIKDKIARLDNDMSLSKKGYIEYIKNIKRIQSLEKNRKIILLLVENYLLRAKRFAVDGALCVVLSENIMKITCSKNTVKVWNEVIGEPECVCLGPVFVWDKSGTACIKQNEAPLKKEDCSDTKRQKYSDGKYHTKKALQQQIETINKRWKTIEERIRKGTLYFHGKVPPDSNYPHSKKEYENAIEKAKKAIAKIHRNGAKQYFSISRAPTSGVWGYSLEKLQKGKAKAQKKLTEKLSQNSREYYSKQVVRSDVLINRWKKKKIKVLKEYQDKIKNSQKMIDLWELEAEKLHRKYLEKIQKIRVLMSEHECEQRKTEKETSAIESSNYKQCPKQNPGNKLFNKFDTNNNPKDNTYITCNYFKDGILAYQAAFKKGKKHGVILSRAEKKAPHRFLRLETYKDGIKHGIHIKWRIEQGYYYKASEIKYIDGVYDGVLIKRRINRKTGRDYIYLEKKFVKGKSILGTLWYDNGVKMSILTYTNNGLDYRQQKFNKKGKPTYCTEYKHNKRPRDCHTGYVQPY